MLGIIFLGAMPMAAIDIGMSLCVWTTCMDMLITDHTTHIIVLKEQGSNDNNSPQDILRNTISCIKNNTVVKFN